MKVTTILFVMAIIAIFVESLLFPFYPQFFQQVFGIESAQYIGSYISSCRLIIMFAFPLWALMSKKIHALKILVITQGLAGMLSFLCYQAEEISMFWICSLSMVFFKSSYLLLYPYLMQNDTEENHLKTISTLSVLVQLSLLVAALVGSVIIEHFNPLIVFVLMGIADFVQMFLSIYLLKKEIVKPASSQKITSKPLEKNVWVTLMSITFLFYFSTAIIRPFFTKYWTTISLTDNALWIGFVFIIPSIVALVLLPKIKAILPDNALLSRLLLSFMVGIIGLILQSIPYEPIMLVGRVIYGASIFIGQVGLDFWLFQSSTKESYAINYSKIHIFQNLGILLAPISAGILIDKVGIQFPFYIAIIGLVMTLGIGWVYYKESSKLKLSKQK